MKNRIIQEILKGILEVAVTVESPTKKDREKYLKKAQVGSGRLKKKYRLLTGRIAIPS